MATLEFSLVFFIFFFLSMSHPVGMGIVICMGSVPIVLLMGHLMGNFWFGYLSFLVLLGAVLVLFMYVSSLVANEVFSFIGLKWGVLMFFCLVFMVVGVVFSGSIESNEMFMGEFYGGDYFYFMGFLVGYLFLTLLVVVGLVQLFSGPLREIN